MLAVKLFISILVIYGILPIKKITNIFIKHIQANTPLKCIKIINYFYTK